MELLRTPDERFENLLDYPFEPHYIEIEGIRIHYVDEGPKDAEVVLLMHGEPTFSFAYRHMIPILAKSGLRAIAPDLVGFGRSDKPTKTEDYTYAKHVNWMSKLVVELDLKKITLFCQDWGSLIGLRVAIENQDRFSRIVLSNGGLPTGKQRLPEAFMNWREYSRTAPSLNIGALVQGGTLTDLSKEIRDAYDAPFPDDTYKAGARILPSLVPISVDDPEHEANKKAFEEFGRWEKPFLTAFADSDPITGGEQFWQQYVPGARGQKHTTIENAAHFVQEDKGPEAAKVVIEFIKNNP